MVLRQVRNGRQQLAVGVEGEIAVHHRRDAEGADRGQLDVVASPDVGGQRGVALLEPGPDRVQGVGPEPVDELVLPVVTADGQRRVVRSDQHRLDPGRAQFDPERGAALVDGLARVRVRGARSCAAVRSLGEPG